MNLKISTSRTLQILLMLMQVGNLLAPAIPMKYKPYIAGVMGLIQAWVNDLSHNSNPDGTPAAQPYIPPAPPPQPPPPNGAPH